MQIYLAQLNSEWFIWNALICDTAFVTCMQKKFIGNLLFVILLNILVKPFWILGIDVAVQNRVGTEEYGLYYPIFGFAILLNILLDFGITNYNNRTIAQHSQMLARYFSGVFNVKLFLGVLYLAITMVLGLIIGFENRALYLLLLLCINQFLSSLILYLRSNIAGLHLFKVDGLLSILDRSLMIIFCGYLLWSPSLKGEFEIEWFVYAQTLAYVITGLIAFILVLRKAGKFEFKLDIKMFRIILRDSLPFALLVLLMSFYYRLDSVMIDRLLPNGDYEAGVYAQAYRILEGFNMFGYLFAGLLLPIFSRMIKENSQVGKLVYTAFNMIGIPAVAAALSSYFFATEIMDLLYVANVEESASVFIPLMFSFVAIALTYVYGTLLTANGSLKALNLISLLGLLINFTLNYLLIPEHGAYGAAIATLVTQAFVVTLQIVIAKRVLKMPFNFKVIIRYILLFSFGILLSPYLIRFSESWIYSTILIFVFFAILSFAVGLVRIKDLKNLLHSSTGAS